MTAPRLTPQQTAIYRMLHAAAGTPVAARYLCAGARATWPSLRRQVLSMRRAGFAIERHAQSYRLRSAA